MDGTDTQYNFGGVLGGPRVPIVFRLGAASTKSLGSTVIEVPWESIELAQIETRVRGHQACSEWSE